MSMAFPFHLPDSVDMDDPLSMSAEMQMDEDHQDDLKEVLDSEVFIDLQRLRDSARCAAAACQCNVTCT